MAKSRWIQQVPVNLCLLMALGISPWIVPQASAQIATTTIEDTVYSANGNVASGTVIVSWPSFTTAANGTVAAGSTTVTIGGDGFFSLNLTPNAGAVPEGTYYTVVYHLGDGTVSKEFWLVPAVAQTTISAIRTQVIPAAVAVQSASKTYVDTSIAALSGTYVALGGGTMTGPLVLSGDPSAASQASNKHYVDAQISSLAGSIGSGTDTNAIHANTTSPQSVQGALAAASLTAPMLNHVVYADQFSSVQAAVTAACAVTPAEMVVIPNAVPPGNSSPEFTNPCAAAVVDQRLAHADVFDPRAYGAVCNGSVDDTAALQAAINAAATSLTNAGRTSAQVQLPDAVCRGNVTLPSGVSLNGHYSSRSGSSQLGGWAPGRPVITVAAGAGSVGIHDLSVYGQGQSNVVQAVSISRTNGVVTVTSAGTVPAVLSAGMQIFLYGAGADTTFNGLYSIASIPQVTQGGVTSNGSTLTYSQIAPLTQCVRNANVVACNTKSPLPNNGYLAFSPGTSVTVSGAADASYNGTFTITKVGNYLGAGTDYPASITYAQTGTNGTTTGGSAYPSNSAVTPGVATDLGGGSGVIVSAVRTNNQLALTIAGPPLYGWGDAGPLTISGSSDPTLNGTWTMTGFVPGANSIAVANTGPNETVSAGTVGDLLDKGIWIPNGGAVNIERVNGFNFGDGLLDWENGEVLFLNQLNATNCLQDVTSKRLRQLPSYPPGSSVVPAVSPMGCVVLNGTDGYMEYSEISTGSAQTSGTISVVDATLPSKAIVNGWNGINNWYQANIGELSDEGIWSGGQFNRWYMNRADLNTGTGIEDQSNSSIWSGNLALHDGSDQVVAPGQWFGINETGGGQNQLGANIWTGNSVMESSALAADIRDGRTSGSGTPNQWSNNFAQSYATPAGYSSSFSFPENDFKQSLSAFTGVLGQNVSGLHNVLLQASAPGMSLNNFTGGVPGQRIQVESSDGNTTLVPGDGFALRTCSGYQFTPLAGNGTTGFTLQGDYEMAWQMDCPQVAPWQIEGHGSLTLLQAPNPTQAATIGVNGPAGTSTYSYVCTQVNYQGQETLPTPAGTTTTGNASLSNASSNTVFCPAAGGTGLIYQKVYRTALPTGSPLQLGFVGTAAITGFTGMNDTGQTIVSPTPPPTANHTADFSTQGSLSIGGGSVVTSSTNIAQTNQANTFTASQIFSNGLRAGSGAQTTVDAAGNLTSTGVTKLASVISSGPRVDVRYYGAVGDGVTDNCTALTNAANAAAGGVLYVPPLVFVTSCSINLPVNESLYIEPSGVVQAKAASGLAAVVIAGSTGFWTDQVITGGGTIDANNTAMRALWLKRQYRGRLANLRMINATNYCLQNGDTADGYTGSNSMDAVEFWCYRTGGAVPVGSYGIWTDNATDSKYVQGYVKGYAEGVRDDVGGSRYGYLHVWDTNQNGSLTTCFDDNAQGNWWSDNICDTPSQYGAILRSFNSHWSNNRFELNGTYGVTNTAIGFHSLNADPTSFFVGNEFTATVTTGMNWAKDFDIVPVANMQSEFIANRPTYVTTKQVGTNDYLRSTNSFGSYKDFGAHTMNSANLVAWSATPTFTLGFANVQKLTLTGNVTGSTWTSSGALQQFLVILCQNTTGGFTFNWGRVVGGGTPSTAAGSCSAQTFYDDGTVLRATAPMQVNE